METLVIAHGGHLETITAVLGVTRQRVHQLLYDRALQGLAAAERAKRYEAERQAREEKRAAARVRTCTECGATFDHGGRSYTTCSPECNEEAHLRRAREGNARARARRGERVGVRPCSVCGVLGHNRRTCKARS